MRKRRTNYGRLLDLTYDHRAGCRNGHEGFDREGRAIACRRECAPGDREEPDSESSQEGPSLDGREQETGGIGS